MLRWLLDPSETHGVGGFFATALLDAVTDRKKQQSIDDPAELPEALRAKEALPEHLDGRDPDSPAVVSTEALSKNLDVFYEDRAAKLTLTIEVKVNAGCTTLLCVAARPPRVS
ncbi:MAG: hypothetical protein DI611_03080 [Brachybacterium faecium]|nr:MAG: hypothetical protein DI611_03080 [Brachybacterium faecium]